MVSCALRVPQTDNRSPMATSSSLQRKRFTWLIVLALIGHFDSFAMAHQSKSKRKKKKNSRDNRGQWLWAETALNGPNRCAFTNCNDLCEDAGLSCNNESEQKMSSISSADDFDESGARSAVNVDGVALGCFNNAVVSIDFDQASTPFAAANGPCYTKSEEPAVSLPSTCAAEYPEQGAICRICFCAE